MLLFLFNVVFFLQEIVTIIEAVVVEAGNAVRLRAVQDCVDKRGK